MGFLNFEEQLVFYGQYHNNVWNRFIHIIFVPLIFWSFLIWLSKIPILILFDRFPVNISFGVTFLYIFYYILLEPVAGAIYAPFLLTLTYSANVFAYKSPHALTVSFVTQIVSWTSQICGHIFIEHRSPAFLDNLIQAFLLAPLFVFMELLFVLGYRPALHKRTRDKIKIAITTWKLKERKAD